MPEAQEDQNVLSPQEREGPSIDFMTYQPPGIENSLASVASSLRSQPPSGNAVPQAVGQPSPIPIYAPSKSGFKPVDMDHFNR